MDCVIYLRVSHTKSLEGFSLEVQEAQCRAYAAARGWTVVRCYRDEAISGRRAANRPGLQQLLSEARTVKARAAVVFELDRAFRNLREQLNTERELALHGVRLCSVEDNIDTATPEGIFHFQLMGAAAEFQANQTARKVKRSLEHKRRQGEWTGRAPLGYTLTATGLIVHDQDAATVQYLRRAYATGQYSDMTLAQHLNAQGYVARDKRGTGVPFTPSALRSILTSRAYVGVLRVGDEEIASHPPLWTEAEYQEIQAMRRSRSVAPGRQGLTIHSSGPALLAGSAYCAICGAKMHYQPSHKGLDADGQPRFRRFYYHCRAARQAQAGHEHHYIQAKTVEAQLLTALGALHLPPDAERHIARYAATQLAQDRPTPPDPHTARRAAIRRARDEGILTEAEARAKLAALPTPTDAPTPAPDLAGALALLQQLPALLAAATDNERRALVRYLFPAIYLEPHRITAVIPRPALLTLFTACQHTGADRLITESMLTLPVWTAYQEPAF